MSDVTYVEKLPQCNLCESEARYDAALTLGAWAYVCTEHWHQYTDGKLGTGLGQKLLVK